MRAISNKIFVRNLESDNLADDFLISAVLSILVIRIYLQITGFPQLGGGGLHIAHMLWGGLSMLISILMFVTLISRHAKKVAVILGGIGFGAFIDELGKFITSDNNYFFRPTIALIYIFFILIYFLFKLIPKIKPISKDEYLLNALELIKEAIINDMDHEEKAKALSYLKKSNKKELIPKYLTNMLLKFKSIKVVGVGRFTILKNNLKSLYFKLIDKPWFIKLIIAVFIVEIIATIFNFGEYLGPLISIGIAALAFPELMELLFSVISTIFLLLGMARLYFARLWSFKMFKISLLISIFLTQIFDFYRIELWGVLDLVFDLLVLGAITYMIDREKVLVAKA